MSNRSDTWLMSLGAALLGVLGGAKATGLLVSDAAAQVGQWAARRRDGEPADDHLLVVAPRDEGRMMLAAHRSHRSHSSHSSHYSGGGGSRRSYGYGGSDYVADPTPAPVAPPPPPPPKPARVSFVAYPGGQIYVDGKPEGTDATKVLKLPAGSHTIRVENRYLGDTTIEVNLSEGQTGMVEVKW